MNEEPSGKTEGSHVGQHWAGTGTLERSDPGEGECRVSVLSAERVEWTRKGGRGGCPLTTLLVATLERHQNSKLLGLPLCCGLIKKKHLVLSPVPPKPLEISSNKSVDYMLMRRLLVGASR